MGKAIYYPPKHATGQFHCPHCGVYAKQFWSHLEATGDKYTKHVNYSYHYSDIGELSVTHLLLGKEWTLSICEHCKQHIIWFKSKMIYPRIIQVEDPNDDLSDDIKKDYLEAAKVLSDSPRSAAAILRLALQKLCLQLGEKGKNINDDIASMVMKGLNPAIQKSLDSLRITGNNAVHPGSLDLSEDVERVMRLFSLINFIAEKMITEPKEIDTFYDSLPEGSRQAVENRDSK